MIIDTSALIAILRDEPNALRHAKSIEKAEHCKISAANYLESAIVIDSSRSPIASRRFDEFMKEANVVIEPVTAEQANIARAAYRDFGKGSGHKAQLNFGDCFAYALAKTSSQPLLFQGDDFAHTDVDVAL